MDSDSLANDVMIENEGLFSCGQGIDCRNVERSPAAMDMRARMSTQI